mmetsp:Transcript_7730/g.10130  ORF Transcript_7730/g.10130 Transcript_7730/m.10130 type:complete len:121 (+) Transcript_7730:191-553(+)|eukprot:CAMPEP_0198145294 /NCGR_PEP_ID=MMETSP1443-20131203/22527_1 /TAXON_ID=186043 /ORGANISM="Entomoneis sp., Strain CCMP2396" /LENGTH=120 /DNA_ID=CAMNT_0043808891 /DNA_START=179 /DNA_END=541 /DNA_ORIENTATION=+
MNSFIASRSASLLRASAFRRAATATSTPRTFATNNHIAKFNTPSLPPSFLQRWYKLFGKSTAQYASWMIIIVLIGEAATSAGRDGLWEMINSGHTYRSTDWSKFDQFGEDDDDEDDDDDE